MYTVLVHISGGEGRTDSGLAPLEGRSSLWGGGVRLPPVSLAPSCQKIFTENGLHRGALRLKHPILTLTLTFVGVQPFLVYCF